MTTAFGPQGPNFATTRPAFDPNASSGSDTWFVNCSQAGALDGTYATADFFNVIVDQLRTVVRNAGVTLDGTNSQMLWQAIQAAIANWFNANVLSLITATRGIKIILGTGSISIQSTLGDGTRTVLS